MVGIPQAIKISGNSQKPSPGTPRRFLGVPGDLDGLDIRA